MTRIEYSLLIAVISTLISSNLACLAPREVVKVPEGVCGEDEVPHRQREKVDHHPTKVCNLARRDDDEDTGKTQDDTKQDEWDNILRASADARRNDEVEGERDGSREHKSPRKLHKHNELHREAECAAEVSHQQEFGKIMNGRINPPATLRQEDSELIGDNRLAHGLGAEHHLALRECFKHERGEVPILAKEEQVFLVECIDNILRVVLDDIRVGEDGYPVAVLRFWCLDAVHAETSR